jgi:hypothetical protein
MGTNTGGAPLVEVTVQRSKCDRPPGRMEEIWETLASFAPQAYAKTNSMVDALARHCLLDRLNWLGGWRRITFWAKLVANCKNAALAATNSPLISCVPRMRTPPGRKVADARGPKHENLLALSKGHEPLEIASAGITGSLWLHTY